MAEKYRKKPVVVEAIQWNGSNKVEIQQFMGQYLDENTITHHLIIPTLEGDHIASQGDYIIKGVHGEFYPCKPDIFAKTYEDATIDPASLRPKGEWEFHNYMPTYDDMTATYQCSNCHLTNDAKSMFCPNCGCAMEVNNGGN